MKNEVHYFSTRISWVRNKQHIVILFFLACQVFKCLLLALWQPLYRLCFLKALCSPSAPPAPSALRVLNYTKVRALTGVARLRVHRNHHFASCSSPGGQGALQRGDAAGRLVAVASCNIDRVKTPSVNHIDHQHRKDTQKHVNQKADLIPLSNINVLLH